MPIIILANIIIIFAVGSVVRQLVLRTPWKVLLVADERNHSQETTVKETRRDRDQKLNDDMV